MSEVVAVVCTHCGKQLKAPADRLGRSAKCPQCQQNFVLKRPDMAAPIVPKDPAPDAAPTPPTAAVPVPTPAVATTVEDRWTLKIPTGEEYGPVSRADLDSWFQEGRINAECQLLQSGAPQWCWASDVFPELALTKPVVATTVADPFAALGGLGTPVAVATASTSSSGVNPYSSPSVGSYSSTAATVNPGSLELGWQSVKSAARVCGVMGFAAAGLIVISTLLMLVISSTGPGSPPTPPKNRQDQQAMQRYQRESMAYQTAMMNAGNSAATMLGLMMIVGLLSMLSIIAFVSTWLVMLDIPRSSRTGNLLMAAIGLFGGGLIILMLGSQTIISGATGGMSAADAGVLSNIIAVLVPLLMLAGLAVFAWFLKQAMNVLGSRSQDSAALAVIGLVSICFILQMLMLFVIGRSGNVQKYLTMLLLLLFAGAFGLLGLVAMQLQKRIQQLQRA